MRFLATADWQLGMSAHYLDDDARPRYHRARFDVVKRIGRLAKKRGAQFIVVAGDVFESNQVGRTYVVNALEALKSAAPIPVYLLPANHDPLDAASVYDSPDFVDNCPPHVHVLRDTDPVRVPTGPVESGVGETVEVVGVPWHTKFPSSNLFEEAMETLPEKDPDTTRVIVAHGATIQFDSSQPDATFVDAEVATRALDEGKADFVVLGDRHSTTEVAESIWYPGSPEVTSRVDSDAGNVLIVDLEDGTNGREQTVEKVPVGSWVYRVIEAELRNLEEVEELLLQLDPPENKSSRPEGVPATSDRPQPGGDLELDEELQPAKDRTLVWLKLSGALTTAQKARLDDGLAKTRQLYALLEIWQRHYDITVLPDEQDFSDLGLSGFGSSALEELLDLAKGGDSVAEDALNLLYRLGVGAAGAKK